MICHCCAIDSVLSQTHQDFEIIVVANGPGFGQTDEIRALTDDPRLRIARNEPGDASAARNVGIDMAEGELHDAGELVLQHKEKKGK